MNRYSDKKNTLTIKEAADLLNISQIMMREIITKLPPSIGFCKYNNKRRTFYINRQNFLQYFNL